MRNTTVLNLIGCNNPKMVMRALEFARQAHQGQKRKYTGDPYFTHCYNVATNVSWVCGNADVIAAAALHDTLEDTAVTYQHLTAAFGEEVAALVLQVTDVSKPEDGSRASRKALDRAYLARSTPAGATIKLADMIDNAGSIVQHDAKFAAIYLPEKMALLGVLQHGNAELWEKASNTVISGFRQLGLPLHSALLRRSA